MIEVFSEVNGNHFTTSLAFVLVTWLAGARPSLAQAESGNCILGVPCIVELSSSYPKVSANPTWRPRSHFLPNYLAGEMDPSVFWLLVVESTDDGSDPCADGYTRAYFECPNSRGPTGPPQTWQNPRGMNADGGYELCETGVTSGNTFGNLSMCWMENPTLAAEDPPMQFVGTFSMYGPLSQQTSCIMGQKCDILLEGQMDDPQFDNSAVFIVMGDGQVCQLKVYQATGVNFNDASNALLNFDIPAPSSSWDGTARHYSLGIAGSAHGNQPSLELGGAFQHRSKYKLCWGISEDSFTQGTADFERMKKGVDIGDFILYGPVVQRDELSCVLTLDCKWNLEGRFHLGMPYGVVITSEDACGSGSITPAGVSGGTWANPQHGTASSTSSFEISFGVTTDGTPDAYTACWGTTPTQNSHYAVRVGTLTIAGPTSCVAPCTCFKGEDCLVYLQASGLLDIQAQRNRIQFLEPGSACGSEPLPTADFGAVMSEVLLDGGAGTAQSQFTVGMVQTGIAKSDYVLCWGAGQDSKNNPYNYVPYDFSCTFYLGTFKMLGASYRDMECILGLPCAFTILGSGLAATNRIIILEHSSDRTNCPGTAHARFQTTGDVLKDDAGDPSLTALRASAIAPHNTYSMPHTPDGVVQGNSQTSYLVCWSNNPANGNPPIYRTPVGKLVLIGPKVAPKECQLSIQCSISVSGIGLASTNKLMIIPLDGHKCGAEPIAPVFFVGVTNPAQVAAVSGDGSQESFQFGIMASSPLQPGVKYQICWAHDPFQDADYRVYVGTFEVTGVFWLSDPACGAFDPGKDPYCVLGEICEIGEQPVQNTIDLQVREPDATNKMAVVLKSPACCVSGHKLVFFQEVKPSNLPLAQNYFPNPVPATVPGPISYKLGSPSLPKAVPDGMVPGIPGDYLLCWAHDPSDNLIDYNTVVGTLQFRGPHPQETQCTLGEYCHIVLRGLFKYYAMEANAHFEFSRVLVSPLTRDCGEADTSLDPPWVGMTNPSPRPEAEDIAADQMGYKFATPFANQPSKKYQLCWDQDPPNGVPVNAGIYQFYRVAVGTFTMNGPYQGQSISCSLGSSCTVQVEGIGLKDTNRLMVISAFGGSCGSIPPNTPMLPAAMEGLNNPRLVTNDIFDNKYDLGRVSAGGSYSECRVAEPRELCIGYHYRMCWSHGGDLNAAGDWPYLVDIGTFALVGVYGTYSVECVLGSVCAFSIYGLNLERKNKVLIIDSSTTCGDMDPQIAKFDGLHNPRSASLVSNVPAIAGGRMEATYQLGVGNSGILGTYRLCWGFDPLVPAHYTVEVGPFRFVEKPFQNRCSVWDNHCYQKLPM